MYTVSMEDCTSEVTNMAKVIFVDILYILDVQTSGTCFEPRNYDVTLSRTTVAKLVVVSQILISQKRKVINWGFICGNSFHAIKVQSDDGNMPKKIKHKFYISFTNIYWVKSNT
jgi:hypothetical protein